MKKINSLENRIIALVLTLVMVFGMVPTGVPALAASVMTTTLEGPYTIDQRVDFDVTTVANADAGTKVLGTIEIMKNGTRVETKTKVVKLEWRNEISKNWQQTYYGDFGSSSTGKALAEGETTNKFRITFYERGNYTVKILYKNATTGKEICSVVKTVKVTKKNPPVITSTLGSQEYLTGRVAEFTVTTTGKDEAGTMILGGFEIQKGGQTVNVADVAALEYRDTETDTWCAFNDTYGPAVTGFPMQAEETTTDFRVTFKKAGEYTVKTFVKDANDGTELCAVEKNVAVADPIPAAITSTFGDEGYIAGVTADFAVTTTGNHDAGTMVLGSFEIQENGQIVNIADIAVLEYYDVATGNWYEFSGDFGPAETGFALQVGEVTRNFRVTFKEHGEYAVKIFLKNVADSTELCALTKNITVAPGIPAEISTTLGDTHYLVGQTADFSVTTVGKDDTGKMVLGSFEIRKNGELVNIADTAVLEYWDVATGAWYTFDGDFGPAVTGFPMQEAATTSNVRVTFKDNGRYTVKIFIKRVGNGEELCAVEKTMFVASDNTAVMNSNLGDEKYVVGKTAEFSITTAGNGEVGTNVRGFFEIMQKGEVVNIADVAALEYYDAANDTWCAFESVFGAEEGFPLLAETISNFRVTFKDNGRYTVKVVLKTAQEGIELSATEKAVFVANAGPVVITSTLGDEQYTTTETAEFTVTTIGNEDADTMVLGSFEIKQNGELVNIADVAKLEYYDAASDSWYEFYSDFGPAETGFPLQFDATTSNFRVTFTKAGEYAVKLSIKTFEDSDELCFVEKSVVVKMNQVDFGFAETDLVITYNDNADNQYTYIAQNNQGDVAYEIVSGTEYAEIDAVTGVLSVKKAGEVTVKATAAGNDLYNPAEATYTLTIHKDAQDFADKAAFEESVNITYGTQSFVKTIEFDGFHKENAEIIYTLEDNDIDAVIDEKTGEVTFANNQIGSVKVVASVEGDDCYESNSASYIITVSYLETEAVPTVESDVWYTVASVTVNAPEGYVISKTGAMDAEDWAETAVFTGNDGLEDGTENTATVYLKNAETGYITDAKTLGGIKLDTQNPTNLAITYAKPWGKVLLETVTFGLYEVKTLDVTVSAQDATSGIASLTYNYNGENYTVEADSYTFTIEADYRNNITLTATDNAGLSTQLVDDQVIVLDNTNPTVEVGYSFVENTTYRREGEILYAQDAVTVIFTITESNADLSGLDLIGKNGKLTALPVLTVNGDVVAVKYWNFENGILTGSYTLKDKGSYVLKLSYTDVAGNAMEEFQRQIIIDNVAPVITIGNIADGAISKIKNNPVYITIEEDNFKSNEVEIVVTAKDFNGNTVVSETNPEGETVEVPDYNALGKNSEWKKNGNEYTLILNFPVDANYDVAVNYTDLAGNVADEKAVSFTVDTVAPTNLAITYAEPWGAVLLNNLTFGLYEVKTLDVTVSAEDATSGIASLTYNYNGEDKTVNADSYTFKIDADYRNNIKLTATDNAGLSTTYVDNTKIVLDNTNPTVEVSYGFTKNTKYVWENEILYAQAPVTVNFAINESNADLSGLELIGEDGELTQLPVLTVNGTVVEVAEWNFASGILTGSYTLAGDGDYALVLNYTDVAGNAMEAYQRQVRIDNAAPVITVVNDQEGGNDNGLYFKDDRTVVVQIVEHNFDATKVTAEVTAKDIKGGNVTAEEIAAVVNALKNPASWTQVEADTYQAEVTFATDAKYTLKVNAADIVGNVAAECNASAFVVDHNAPTDLKIEYSEPVSTWENILETITFGAYNPKKDAPLVVTLTATDLTAGVDYFEWFYTREAGASESNAASGNAENANRLYVTQLLDQDPSVSSVSFELDAQARGYISFRAVDASGNISDADETTEAMDWVADDNRINIVDTIAPGRTVSYTPNRVVDNKTFKDTAWNEQSDVTMYFKTDAVAIFEIVEANFYPEDVVITVNGEAASFDQENWTKTEGDTWTNTLTIKEEGEHVIAMSYADRSGNVMNTYSSHTIVIDKSAPKVEIQYSNTDVKNTYDGRDYFADKQTATITITERNFRADDVVIKVTAKDILGNSIKVADYAEQYKNSAKWTAVEGVEDTYEATLVFDTDANYTFDIEYQDLATNSAADYAQKLFTVDGVAPDALEISYSKNIFEVILDTLTFGYYQAQLDVTITATDNIAGVDHFVYSYMLADNVSAVNAEEKNVTVAATRIDQTNGYTATFKIPMKVLNPTNQFNGSVNFTAYDRSGKQTARDDKASVRVIVDNIAPTANITYNAPVQTINGVAYYDGNINATISINEANFDAKDVVVTVTKDGANYPVNVYWSDRSADIHNGSLTLTEDGIYTVSVQYTDKSKNKMADYESTQMTLDATMPVIEVSDIKANSANKDENYGFVITISDTNLDASAMVPVLKTIVQKEDGIYASKEIDLGEPVAVVEGRSYTYTVENLPEDGLYTLTCSAKDKSGNLMNQVVLADGESYEQVQFSINRDGSTFAFGNQFTEDLVGQYYIYSVDEDVAIVEVNVDPIENYTVTLNGKELTEGTDYTTQQTSNAGEWSKRTYTIRKELFQAEGEYNIIVSSVDKTETTAYSDVKNLTMAFVVDQTKPVITITGMESGGRYQTDLQTVTLIPSDEGGRLNALKVILLNAEGAPFTDENGADISVRFDMSGEELLAYLDENDGMITFTIPAGLNNQVKIICNDCAENAEGLTNEYNELFARVTVSQNQFVIFYANTPAFVGAIVGILAVAGLIVFLIKRKGSKKAAKKA